MADVIYKKGQSSNLDNVQIKEGQILVTEDTGEMYIDVTDSDRKKINPQADWQQNDETANDYVKNRPGGYEVLTAILPETTLNFTDEKYLVFTDCSPIEVGTKYKVTFDGIEYELVGRNDGHSVIFIGNESYTWGSTDTGEPFLIYSENNSTPTICISSSETLPCTHNIEIKAIIPIKIDEKYLDIKNTNIVNGSAKGSLRTVGSAEESSEYTIGNCAFTEGGLTKASGSFSHAEGYDTKASGDYSHAEGYDTKASGYCSHAEGNGTTASGYGSHAEGCDTIASGYSSHAEGYFATASGDYSHAEGGNTIASGQYSHAQGKYNISNTTYADVIGNGSSNTKRSNASTVDWNGNAWYAGDIYVGSTSGTNKDAGSKKVATEEYVNNKKVSSFSVYKNKRVHLDWGSVYLIQSNTGEFDIDLKDGNTDSTIIDRKNKALPKSSTCLLFLPKEQCMDYHTSGEWVQSHRMCLFLGLTKKFSLTALDAMKTVQFKISGDKTPYFTVPDTQNTFVVFKIGL